MERNLRRLKQKKYPKNPINGPQIINTFEDPINIENFAFNLRRTNRFYIDTVKTDLDQWFTVFASQSLIKMIENHIPAEERRYLIDGTFKVRPLGNFYQLVVIYIEFKNDVSFMSPIISAWICKSLNLFIIIFQKKQYFSISFEFGVFCNQIVNYLHRFFRSSMCS